MKPHGLPSMFQFTDEHVRRLETQMMHSDALRARVVAGAFGAFAVGLLVLWANVGVFAGTPLAFFQRVQLGWIALVAAFLCVYELVYLRIELALLKRGLRIPLPPRVFSATLETSVPTLLLALLCQALEPSVALNLPPVQLYYVFLALTVLRVSPFLALYVGVLAGVEYTALAWVWLGSSGATPQEFVGTYVSKALLLVATGGILAVVTGQIRKRILGLLEARERQERTAAIFGQHVSPAVMEKLLAQDAGPSSEVRHVTVMFLDIRNFTAFSEARSPDEVVNYLNRLFAFMVDAVNRHQGLVNKFLGDGFMAVFGAPLDDGQSEHHAVEAALEISDHLARALGEGLEPTRIGIGLHSGDAVTGNVGSSQRQEYTLIGDVVNLASRIESQTKALGAEILISRSAWEAARRTDPTLPGEGVGPVAVKGREQAVDLVRVR